LFSVALLAGLLTGIGVSCWTVWRNEWFYYGLPNLAGWTLLRSCRYWVLVAFQIGLAAYVSRRLIEWWKRERPVANHAYALLVSIVAGSYLVLSWGLSLNRYTYRPLWRDVATVAGHHVPLALLSGKLLLANAGVVLAGVVTGVASYNILRRILRRLDAGPGFRRGWAVILVADAGLLAVLAVLFVAGASPAMNAKPNVILISLDTLRADHLHCYNYPLATSPNIDALAAGGIVFENSVAQANWTLPSHMSIMTSQLPMVHGVINRQLKLAPSEVTLAEILKNEGYATVGITGGYNVDARFGFSQGFDEYHGDKLSYLRDEERRKYGQGVRLARLLPQAIAKISKLKGRPFYLFLHAWDVHAPYMPHEGYIEKFSKDYHGDIDVVTHEYMIALNQKTKRATEDDLARIRALYDNEILFADHYLGELFKALDRLDLRGKTIIVLTSDHGDSHMEHGFINHNETLFNPEIHVPLIISYPGRLPAGRRVKAVVRGIDVAPTILDLAGVPYSKKVAHEFQGQSLVGSWDGNHRQTPAISEAGAQKGWKRRLAIRSGRYKLIWSRDLKDRDVIELYDLEADPGEYNDISTREPEVAKNLRMRLEREIRDSANIRSSNHAGKLRPDAEFEERLKGLGYLN